MDWEMILKYMDPKTAAVLTAGLVAVIFILSRRINGLKIGKWEVCTGRDIDAKIENSLRLFEKIRDHVFELYTPIKQHVQISVMKTYPDGSFLISELVDRYMSLENWRYFRKRMFTNNFNKNHLDKEAQEMAINIRTILINNLLLKSDCMVRFDETKILPEAHMKVLVQLIQKSIESLHCVKRLIAHDNKTDVDTLTSTMRTLKTSRTD
jgi:hypothetical protein